MSGTLLSIGHGYSARVLGQRLAAEGWRIVGTSRTARAEPGVEMRVWPGEDLADAIAEATHVLTSVSPGEEGDPVLATLGKAIAASSAIWVGYLSTTGVYGDHGGGWVDETAPLTPATTRGRRRVAAEAAWAGLRVPLHVFRLAGIYGPGRGPFEKVRAGRSSVIKPGQVFSRIHVDDIAAVLHASMLAPSPGVWNVADDEPAPPQDVLAYAAGLLGLPPPAEVPFDEADLSPMARSFYAESKRVRNDRMKRDLGVSLLYPTYREGLRALLATERS
ncbi:SDR family oxidoreductase [Roseitranquillus sediminis]|uniref:SDR family oxidoreductase n=1 Tax=Roseitranquillus sediminis TaxID=2809051 RepID=UPI001D0BF8BC|nr:SDR family oxidoreductase [Roseitranquillus sediminis]MBM9594537.1 SDR family oxidoreductase [Roseitranquillus sediminis]